MAGNAELSVRRLMTPDPYRILPSASVQDALDVMNRHRVGAILVVEESDRLVGIFTERDFLRRVCGSQPGWRQTPVRDWMSPYPYTIHPDAGWDEAVTSMERLSVRHLPVLENGKVIGILTTRQLMAHRATHLNRVVSDRTQELKRANEELLARDSEVNHYMKAAARLQKRLVLPHQPPSWPEISWGVHFAPLDPLGGDFYDFSQPTPDHMGILIADASGHGVPAALVAIVASVAFAEVAPTSVRPGEVLARMNMKLMDLADERFVTAFYGIFDRRQRTFTYANAGHPFPIRFSSNTGKTSLLSVRGMLLGVMADEQYSERSVTLESGDRLLFYTDGVPDCRDGRGETYGADRLMHCLQCASCGTAPGVVNCVVDGLNEFRAGTKPVDDMTLVVGEVH